MQTLEEPSLLEANYTTPSYTQFHRFRFLNHPIDSSALRRVQDATLADPECDVVGAALRIAVGDEIARLRFIDERARVLLLVGVARDEPPCRPEAHMHESRAIDTGGGHAAPEIRRARERAGVIHRIRCNRREPVRIAVAPELGRLDPTGVVVGRPDPRPAPDASFDGERFAGKDLRHLLGTLARLCPDRRQVAGERMFA